MTVVLGIVASAHEGERRIAMVPDVAKKLAGLGVDIIIQTGAGVGAFVDEQSLPDARWVTTASEVLGAADILWSVDAPSDEVLAAMRPETILVGALTPYGSAERVRVLAERGITSFALELLPRISRAQSMDILTSQASASGYQSVLIAATRAPKFFPMLTYAAGTIRPARVLVIGAGVAGLQAIATAKRLGAVVEGYDVRSETREQVESLGAKFLDVGVSASGEGGYARELTDAEKAQQRDKLARAIAQCDVLVTTAAIPGRPAPLIVTRPMVLGMKSGAVVVDMAAEGGGNVEGTVAGKEVLVGGARVIGPVNLPSRMPVSTSEMFAKNLFNFTAPMITEGALAIDWSDEVIAKTALTRDGRVVHPLVAKTHGFEEASA